MAKPGLGSEIVMIPDERVLAVQVVQAAREMPSIANMNVSNSSKVHVGPKFVNVNQTVQNKEMVKDLPLPKYLWHILKHTSAAERLACLAAVTAIIIFVLLIVYYNIYSKSTALLEPDIAPHEWNITREMWLAESHHWNGTQDPFNPLKIVVIGHTAGSECHSFKECAAAVRNLQQYLIKTYDYDIQYNFLVGNDGRIYEGLGWNREGAHTRSYNNCTLGVAFMGDYRKELPDLLTHRTRVTELQLNNTLRLFQEGVRMGYLRPDFLVVGARDIAKGLAESPGENLYYAIQKWDHYDHQNQFRDRTCNEIYGLD